MSNPELCCNCTQWDTCKAEGALPNDYCGMYQPFYTEEELAIREHCRKQGLCNDCKYSTADYDCSMWAVVKDI